MMNIDIFQFRKTGLTGTGQTLPADLTVEREYGQTLPADLTVEREYGQVKELFECVYLDTFGGTVPSFSEATEGEAIYIAVCAGQVAGLITIWEPTHFIHFLFVKKEFRRKHIASRLIRKAGRIYGYPFSLRCRLSNQEAMDFYEKNGWIRGAEGYSENGPCVLYWLEG